MNDSMINGAVIFTKFLTIDKVYRRQKGLDQLVNAQPNYL